MTSLRMLPQRSIAVDFNFSQDGGGLEAMAAAVHQLCSDEGVKVLVAHGLAIPLAIQAVGPDLELLVISNGPTTKLDPVTKALSRLPGPFLKKLLLRPRALNAWLSSSVGLRRAVVNPYVMDKETVEKLTAPLLGDDQRRSQTADWLRELSTYLPIKLPRDLDVVALWGDGDRLYPMAELDEIEGIAVQLIPGGRFLHPQERPWEMADACIDLIAKSGT